MHQSLEHTRAQRPKNGRQASRLLLIVISAGGLCKMSTLPRAFIFLNGLLNLRVCCFFVCMHFAFWEREKKRGRAFAKHSTKRSLWELIRHSRI